MPTGYTSFIEDGIITNGKDFLKLCLRNFGISIDIRDEPLSVPVPTVATVGKYYGDRVEAAQNEYAHWKNMSLEEARNEMIFKHEKEVKHAQEMIAKLDTIYNRYDTIEKEINSWVPPSNEYNGIKEFALNQIKMSREDYGMYALYQREANETINLDDESVKEFLDKKIEQSSDNLDRALESYKSEQRRIESRNKFMKNFMDSLENMSGEQNEE